MIFLLLILKVYAEFNTGSSTRSQQQLLRLGPESASEDHRHEDQDRPPAEDPGCPEGSSQRPGGGDAETGGT